MMRVGIINQYFLWEFVWKFVSNRMYLWNISQIFLFFRKSRYSKLYILKYSQTFSHDPLHLWPMFVPLIARCCFFCFSRRDRKIMQHLRNTKGPWLNYKMVQGLNIWLLSFLETRVKFYFKIVSFFAPFFMSIVMGTGLTA